MTSKLQHIGWSKLILSVLPKKFWLELKNERYTRIQNIVFCCLPLWVKIQLCFPFLSFFYFGDSRNLLRLTFSQWSVVMFLNVLGHFLRKASKSCNRESIKQDCYAWWYYYQAVNTISNTFMFCIVSWGPKRSNCHELDITSNIFWIKLHIIYYITYYITYYIYSKTTENRNTYLHRCWSRRPPMTRLLLILKAHRSVS